MTTKGFGLTWAIFIKEWTFRPRRNHSSGDPHGGAAGFRADQEFPVGEEFLLKKSAQL
jgi:hypothetical protein